MSESDPIQSCQLIGFAGIMVQLILGALSFSVLVYKRYTETPKRAWKIWAMDTSKQGVSQFLAHVINVAISMQLSSKLDSDACIWYFTTNVLDNTVGVLICIGILSIVEQKLLEPNYRNFQSGNYYTVCESFEEEKVFTGAGSNGAVKPFEITMRKSNLKISYFDWFVQFLIWNAIVVATKSLLFQLEILLSSPLISISTVLLGWIQPYETLQLILVIIIAPVIMNGFAFWFQDNFLKKKEDKQEKAEETPDQKQKEGQNRTSTNSHKLTPDVHEPLL